jgi:hypothetical protein
LAELGEPEYVNSTLRAAEALFAVNCPVIAVKVDDVIVPPAIAFESM